MQLVVRPGESSKHKSALRAEETGLSRDEAGNVVELAE